MSSNKTSTRLQRREFLVGGCMAMLAGASTGAAGCNQTERSSKPSAAPKRSDPPHPSEWWEGGKYVDHKAVNTSRLKEGVVRARVDGRWQDFRLGQLPDRFVNWSLKQRISRLDKLATEGFNPQDLDGPHNGCVATYGGWQRDSQVSLNTAYKGIGFVPTRRQLPRTLAEIDAAAKALRPSSTGDWRETMKQKTKYLAQLYRDPKRFDRTKLVSLELFTTPHHATHTFLNMMANPIASFSFLAFPTFEVRAVPQLLHPDNPALDDHQRNIIAYTNAIHNFAHGGQSVTMTCVYHVLEVYNDSPSEKDGQGRRIA